jgi:hypothetical protein
VLLGAALLVLRLLAPNHRRLLLRPGHAALVEAAGRDQLAVDLVEAAVGEDEEQLGGWLTRVGGDEAAGDGLAEDAPDVRLDSHGGILPKRRTWPTTRGQRTRSVARRSQPEGVSVTLGVAWTTAVTRP